MLAAGGALKPRPMRAVAPLPGPTGPFGPTDLNRVGISEDARCEADKQSREKFDADPAYPTGISGFVPLLCGQPLIARPRRLWWLPHQAR
jgi:hypothetical protein